MPAADKKSDAQDSGSAVQNPHSPTSEGPDKDKKSSKAGGSSKSKDLSHVPCKFFRVGSCTAGASCPFSHTVLEPGQNKDICTWFIKGNCKFGHKCALAHVLPGQSMSMDRKNKKAAQLASSGGGGSSNSGAGSSNRRGGGGRGASGVSNGRSNSLLGGSGATTAPTRARVSSTAGGRPPGLTAAALSPPAPAPPVQDTDFIISNLDEASKLATAPARASSSTPQATPSKAIAASTSNDDDVSLAVEPPHDVGSPSAAPIPVTRRPSAGTQAVRPDFGPIGSPSRATGLGGRNGNGAFSPGTSPVSNNIVSVPAQGLPSSPFSAPGGQTAFSLGPAPGRPIGGIAASLGAARHLDMWNGGGNGLNGAKGVADDTAVDEDDLEEFVPGSLSDLLTPEERSRRLSRTSSARPTGLTATGAAGSGIGVPTSRPPGVEALHHKYSRSVPAPQLLDELRSIWGPDSSNATANVVPAGNGLPSSPGSGGLGNGTSSSFKSTGFGGRAGEDAFSPSHAALLSPTNASAAFLPGLHQHYSAARAGRQPPSGARSTSSGTAHVTGAGMGAGMGLPGSLGGPSLLSLHANAGGAPPTANAASTGLGSSAMLPPRSNVFGSRPPPFDLSSTNTSTRGASELDSRLAAGALSPSALALQAHAPGQSLPQGLAAGYSRIHAQPPPPALPSPAAAAFSPPASAGIGYTEWLANNASAGEVASSPGRSFSNTTAGLDAAFSRMSFAPTTAARAPPGMGGRTTSGGVPRAAPGPGGAPWAQGGIGSPLARPVPTTDDDDLFQLDHY